jgi:hydroxymethylglutaryl-CoA lyase
MSSAPKNEFPTAVEIIEVGPRDGLQREPVIIPVEQKVALINALVDAGLKRIQVTSFVHPRLVPQMADAEEVCARLIPYPEVQYSGLALNLEGIERAQLAGIKHIDMSVSASEAHSLRNANRTVSEALTEYGQMVDRARSYNMIVRGGIQCAFGYQDPSDVDPKVVISIAHHFLADLDIDELALADSSGMANPRQLTNLLQMIVPMAGGKSVILHLHDTRGMGLANVLAAMRSGVYAFDTSFGGLGGCPFIDDAAGNIATEDTVNMLDQMGIETGVELNKLAHIAQDFEHLLGKVTLPGKLYKLLLPA